jgi:hypothetical protein
VGRRGVNGPRGEGSSLGNLSSTSKHDIGIKLSTTHGELVFKVSKEGCSRLRCVAKISSSGVASKPRKSTVPVRVATHPTNIGLPAKWGCTATYSCYYHEILWWSGKQYTAINLYYLYLARSLMLRPLVEALGGGVGVGSSATAAFRAPLTRRFLTIFS